MAVDILYFAWVREAIGRDGERIDPPAGLVDVAALVDWLAERGGAGRLPPNGFPRTPKFG